MLSYLHPYLYVLGGYDGYDCLRDVERLNLSLTNPSFEILPPLSHPIKNGLAYVHKDGKNLYLLCGWDERETQDKIFRYDTTTFETQFVAYLPTKLESASLAAFDDTLFLFGGFDGFGVTDRIVRIDTRTWEATVETGCRLKHARENHTCEVLNGDTVVIAGGWSNGKSMD